MSNIICDRCFKEGHTNTNCIEVYDIEDNLIIENNLETPETPETQILDTIYSNLPENTYSQNSYQESEDLEWQITQEKIEEKMEEERLYRPDEDLWNEKNYDCYSVNQDYEEKREFMYEDYTDLWHETSDERYERERYGC
jgi:hypothetical protein